MQRTRMLVLAVVALGLSAVVTYLIYRELNSRAQTEEIPTNQIVVAAQLLAVGVPIEPQHLSVIDWPGEPLGGSFSTTDEVIGRGEPRRRSPLRAGGCQPKLESALYR